MPGRDVAVDDVDGTDAVDRGRAERGDEPERHEEDPAEHRRADARVAHRGGAPAEHRVLTVEVAEQLDEHRARHVEALGHLRVHRRVVLHLLTRDVLQPASDSAGRDDEHREHGERHQGQPPLEGEHRAQRRDQHDDVAHHAAERARDRGLGADHVVVEAARDRTGRRAGEERDRQPLHLGEQGSAQVGDQALTDAGAAPALDDLQRGVTQRRADGGRGEPEDEPAIAVGDRGVEDLAGDERRDEGEQRGDEDRDEEQGDGAAVRLGELPHPASGAASPTWRPSPSRRRVASGDAVPFAWRQATNTNRVRRLVR